MLARVIAVVVIRLVLVFKVGPAVICIFAGRLLGLLCILVRER